jgi:uncharacterized protein
MKVKITRGVSVKKLDGILPPSYKRLLRMKDLKNKSYTVMLFDLDKSHVTISATVSKAIERIAEMGQSVLAIGGNFTYEAVNLLKENRVEILSLGDFGWSDASYNAIKIPYRTRLNIPYRRGTIHGIKIERRLNTDRLDEMEITSWPIWEKEVSEFPWHYDEMETCYLLEGDVIVIPQGGSEPVRFGKGDLVTFPKGMSCTWKVLKPVRKHYRFG